VENREKAKALYTSGETVAEIAKQLGVSVSTVRSWKSRDKWDVALDEISVADDVATDIAHDEISVADNVADVSLRREAQIKEFRSHCNETIEKSEIREKHRENMNKFNEFLKNGGSEDDYSGHIRKNFKGREKRKHIETLKLFHEFVSEIPPRAPRKSPTVNKKILMFAGIPACALIAIIAAAAFVSTFEPDNPGDFPETTAIIVMTEPFTIPPEPATIPATEPITEPATPPPTPPTIAATEPPSATSRPATTPRTSASSRPVTTPRTTATSRPATIPATEPITEPATSPPIPPTTPNSLRISANSAGGIELSWSVVANADGYEVSRSVSMIGGYHTLSAITVRDGSRVRITDSGVSQGQTYFYSVRAFRNVGGVRVWSEYSEIVSAAT
jgi:hypothetical protein